MGLWVKIELFMNKVLGWLFGHIGNFVAKQTPESILVGQARLRYRFQETLIQIFLKVKRFIHFLIQKALENFKKAKEIKIKEQVELVKSEMSSLKGKKPWEILSDIISHYAKKLSEMEPKKAFLILAGIGVLFLSIVGIIFSGSRIYEKNNPQIKGIGFVEELPPRPEYYKKDKRQVSLVAVKVPIYSTGRNEVQFLTVDFDLQMSNRLVVIHIQEHESQVRDHLINNIEPMDPSFSLEDEGKRVMKEKLRLEINQYLKNNQIEGQVDDVNIVYLLGT